MQKDKPIHLILLDQPYFDTVIHLPTNVYIQQVFQFDVLVCTAGHLCKRKYALICAYFEPKKLRARPPNKAATPSLMKLDLFQLKGRGGFIWGPSP